MPDIREEARAERARIEQSNEVAGIVFDEHKKAWPDLHPVLDLRYGIADALWAAGYRKPEAAPTDTTDEVLVEGSYFKVADLPKILGNYMRSSAEYAREAKENHLKLVELKQVIVELQPAPSDTDREAEAEAMSIIMQKHYLDTLSARLSPDNHSSCICGEWSEGEMEPGWDDHLGEVLADAGFSRSQPVQVEVTDDNFGGHTAIALGIEDGLREVGGELHGCGQPEFYVAIPPSTGNKPSMAARPAPVTVEDVAQALAEVYHATPYRDAHVRAAEALLSRFNITERKP